MPRRRLRRITGPSCHRHHRRSPPTTPARGPSLPARTQRIQSRRRPITNRVTATTRLPNRVTAMTRRARSPLMGTGHPRLTTTVDPEHSKPVARSAHGRRSRDQQVRRVRKDRVRKDGAQQHGQTPLRGLDRRLHNRGVPVRALHPARQRTTTNAPDDTTTTATYRVRGPYDGFPAEKRRLGARDGEPGVGRVGQRNARELPALAVGTGLQIIAAIMEQDAPAACGPEGHHGLECILRARADVDDRVPPTPSRGQLICSPRRPHRLAADPTMPATRHAANRRPIMLTMASTGYFSANPGSSSRDSRPRRT